MPSKMSLWNKEISTQIVRSTGWVSLVYFIGLFIALPLGIMQRYSDEMRMPFQRVDNLYQFTFQIQMSLTLAVPVLLAVFLFRYLHVKQASDLMHSLPLKRDKLFHTYALNGILYLIIPVVLIAILTSIIHSAMGLSMVFNIKDVFYWAGTTILVDLVLFTAAIFIAMLTGISAVQAVLTYILLFFPVGIMLLAFYNFKVFLFGYPSDYFLTKQVEKMSPLTYAAELESGKFTWAMAAVYGVLIILLYVFSLVLYKKRKLESASEAIAFKGLRGVFKYGATFCSMLTGGTYFSQTSNSDIWWTIIGYAIGAIIGYFAAEMVLQKTWRVLRNVKGLAVYSGVIAILILAIHSLGFYENRIPDSSEIQSVLMTDSLNIARPNGDVYTNAYGSPYTPIPMKEKANIEAVRRLHKQILADRKQESNDIREERQLVFLVYNLKDGGKVIREYRMYEKYYADLYKPIYESAEFKQNTYDIFRVKENKVKSIIFNSNGPSGSSAAISSPEDVKKAIALLRKDILEESYDDRTYFQSRGSNIEIRVGKHQFINLQLSPTYKNTNEWLEGKGLLEQAKITAKNLDAIFVAKNTLEPGTDPEREAERIQKDPQTLKITDPDQMNEAINSASVGRKEYLCVFTYKGGNFHEIFYFDDKHVPGFIKEHFE
ncbi:DUF6449 domain-containing protein [Neobacillus terrae]|uniref:DUF6449 domain-containing protein n=1 Tax=Neobacillus terrae TaxID=3034837 RepID=UPI001A9CA4DE|nr:DUF6449 domain-containing protein [Neobacillus terrae]